MSYLPAGWITPRDIDSTITREETPANAAKCAIAIQAAIDSFTANSGVVLLGEGYPIDRPIHLPGGISLIGSGWGRSNILTAPSSYLKWLGTAGDPMILSQANFGARIKSLRLIGNSLAKPSYAVQFDTGVGEHQANDSNGMEDVWIGHMFGYDSDLNNQFDRGFGITGTINSDTNTFKHLVFWGIDKEAIHLPNPNAGPTSFECIRMSGVGAGIRTAAPINIDVMFCHCAGYVFTLETKGKVYVTDLACEGSGGLLQINGDTTAFVARDGGFQIQAADVVADGRIIDVAADAGSGTTTHVGWNINLDNFYLQYNGGVNDPPQGIKFRLYDPTPGHITLGAFRAVNCRNIWPSTLELGSLLYHNDDRSIVLDNPSWISQDHPIATRVQFDFSRAEDNQWQIRNDFAAKLNNYGGPFNVRRLITPVGTTVAALIGSGATQYSYRISCLTYDGETDVGAAVTVNNAASLAPGVATNKISWMPFVGAIGYRIYGRTGGSEQLLKTVTYDDLHGPGGLNIITHPPSWIDDGSLTPSGALPAKNTTGNALIEGRLTLPNAGGTSGWKTPLYLGAYALWVDGGGKLRIKSGAPTSDTDGVIVGLQS